MMMMSGQHSACLSLKYGVPQDSVLSPILHIPNPLALSSVAVMCCIIYTQMKSTCANHSMHLNLLQILVLLSHVHLKFISFNSIATRQNV